MKKKKMKKKMNKLTGASHLAFVSREMQHVQIREEGDPPAFVNKRGFQCTCEERERSAGKNKKQKQKANQVLDTACTDLRKEGAPTHICKREGPLCTCERRGVVSEK